MNNKRAFTLVELLVVIAITGATVCLLLTGCGGSVKTPDGFPPLFPCKITVTQENAPLANARVQLVPDDGAKDWAVSNFTDTSGVAAMYTYGKYEGAPAGKYKVVVAKTETDPSKFTAPPETDGEAYQKYQDQVSNENLPVYNLVEKVYMDSKSSTLTMEVTGKTSQTFDVGKKVREKL